MNDRTSENNNLFFSYLDMPLFGFSILNMLPKVVADGSEGGMHFYAKIAPESYWCFMCKAFLLTGQKIVQLFDLLK